jgi:hypothetical protein
MVFIAPFSCGIAYKPQWINSPKRASLHHHHSLVFLSFDSFVKSWATAAMDKAISVVRIIKMKI